MYFGDVQNLDAIARPSGCRACLYMAADKKGVSSIHTLVETSSYMLERSINLASRVYGLSVFQSHGRLRGDRSAVIAKAQKFSA